MTGEVMRWLVDEAHGPAHNGVNQMRKLLQAFWNPDLKRTVENKIIAGQVCQQYNVRLVQRPKPGEFKVPEGPGKITVMDFTDMGVRAQGKKFLLVIVDEYSGWVEAYPMGKEDAKTVIKCLVNYYIPQHGFPRTIRSDNGSHFKNQDLATVEKMMGLKHKYGTVYHPESQGKEERVNGVIKNKLVKILVGTKLSWVEALPIALMSIRSTVNQTTGFTPFELQHGHLFSRTLGPHR